MFANYDAKAVAEIMGLAFVRGSDEGRAREGDKSTSAKSGDDFVIRVNDALMLIVELKAKSALAPLPCSHSFVRGWPPHKPRTGSMVRPHLSALIRLPESADRSSHLLRACGPLTNQLPRT
jgi:hypothetical protein